MNRAFLLCFIFFAFTCLAEAHTFAPPTLDTVAASDTVYFVRVTAIKEQLKDALGPPVVFSVNETLRGNPTPVLNLTVYEAYNFKEGSDYLFIHHPGGFKDRVGYCISGDSEWFPLIVTHDGDNANVQWLGPLDKVREYLKQHPYTP